MLGYLSVIKCKVSCYEQNSLHGLSKPVQNCLLFCHLIKLTCLSPYPPVCSQWHDDVYFPCIFVKIMWACRSHTMWLEFSDNKTVKFYHKSSITFCWVTIWQMIHKLIARKLIIFQSACKSKWIQFKVLYSQLTLLSKAIKIAWSTERNLIMRGVLLIKSRVD